ncbi:MAG: methyltransferase domain-containing protein [Ahniella sp.]|nr:methyltransferase domain-containing protein [Ahniella sp.]
MTDLPESSNTDPRATSWSRYWASGALHSCPGSFSGNYQGSMAAFWLDAFVSLAPGDRVLDLCTGNGAIPRWLLGLDGGTDRGAIIDAVDLASISPAWCRDLTPEQSARLQIRGGVSVEALPFDDATFDLVTSQYGIEYAQLDRVFTEIARVSKPGARLQMLMHHSGSRPVRMGVAEAGALMRQLSADGLFAAVPALLDFLALANDPAQRAQLAGNEQAEQARAAFNQAQRALAASMSSDPMAAPMLDDLRAQVQRAGPGSAGPVDRGACIVSADGHGLARSGVADRRTGLGRG